MAVTNLTKRKKKITNRQICQLCVAVNLGKTRFKGTISLSQLSLKDLGEQETMMELFSYLVSIYVIN